jgi:hypothetical protein
MDKSTKAKLRFRSYIKKNSSGCWIWTGNLCKGYGSFFANGKTCRAHRWIYELVNGPIPEGLEIHHRCNVKACVNPSHLEAVTHLENAKQAAKWGVWNGPKNGNSKLEAQEVIMIRKLSQSDHFPPKRLAELFEVSLRTIYNVLSYETYFYLVPDLYKF